MSGVNGQRRGPLDGVRVLDISTVYAAPFAASLLGDYGADVLKVELPGSGDPLRGMEPFEKDESLVWAALARNKRSITLNLKHEKGQAIFLRLLEGQDVLFENFRPGTLERWGLGREKIREANPNLVIVRVSGYGQTGPSREKAGFGTPATAFSGYAYINGYPDRPPLLPPISLTDYVTGMFAAIGALSALYYRDALNGEGQEVDAALYESLFRLLETVVAPYHRLGEIRERAGNQLGSSVPAGIFTSGDGREIVLTTSTDRTFRRLARLMDREDMNSDPRYANNRSRVSHREEVDGIVSEWFGARTAEEILSACDEVGVPVSLVNNMADIFSDEHFAAREMLPEIEHATLGKIAVPGVVPKFSETPGELRHAGPGLGEHNEEVYRALGLEPEELSELEEEGVI